MREILFRGQKADTKEWIFGDLIQLEKDFKKVVEILDWSKVNNKKKSKSDLTVISETVGQFTGITDRNGKKIFEGDILMTNEADWVGKVEFKHSAYIISDDNGGYSTYPDFSKCEVIGNFFDNPELLNNHQNVR